MSFWSYARQLSDLVCKGPTLHAFTVIWMELTMSNGETIVILRQIQAQNIARTWYDLVAEKMNEKGTTTGISQKP